MNQMCLQIVNQVSAVCSPLWLTISNDIFSLNIWLDFLINLHYYILQILCTNGGYADISHNYQKCVCPGSWIGKHCERYGRGT